MRPSTITSFLLFRLSLASAFGPLWKQTSRRSQTATTTMHWMSEEPAEPTLPPLEAEDIEELLDHVPLYAITSIENDSILLMEEETKNVANFFLSKELADTVVSGHEDTIRVDSYSLGKVYFQLFDPDDSIEKDEDLITVVATNDRDVEYRLVPDTREVDQAQALLSQRAGVNEAFSKGYDEVPLFMDQHLRLATGSKENDDYREIFPIYFGWNDLAQTCQEYVRAFDDAGEAYDAAISVSELKQLVEQMKNPSPVDFRNVQFVPASPRPLNS
eukprot:scaffold5605_cov128-Cylindrotheca_fusiformis.AAC.4